MPSFSYIVKDKEGKTFKNTVNFATKDALINHLQKKELFIVNISDASHISTAKKSSAKKKKRKTFRRKKIQLQDLLVFSRQLATMLDAGVPLVRSLDVIKSQIESAKFFKVIQA